MEFSEVAKMSFYLPDYLRHLHFSPLEVSWVQFATRQPRLISESALQCKLNREGAGPLNGALSAWQVNRCSLKVLIDGNLKNGLI